MKHQFVAAFVVVLAGAVVTYEIPPFVNNTLFSINSTLDPCEDFYEFTCNSWRLNRPVDKTAVQTVYDNAKKAIKDILNSEEENKPYHHGLNNARKFYKICMDINRINQRGMEPFKRQTRSFQGFPAIDPHWNNEFGRDYDWMRADVKIGYVLQNSPLVGISFNWHNSKKYIQVGFKYPLSLNDPERRSAFNRVLSYIDQKDHTSELLKMMKLEDEVMKASSETKPSVWMKMDDLRENEFLFRYMSIFREGLTKEFIKDLHVNVDYLKELERIMKKTDRTIVANYIGLCYLFVMSYAIPEKASALYQPVITLDAKGRSDNCFNTADRVFQYALGREYIRKYFPDSVQLETLTLSRYVKEEFLEMLSQAEWLKSEDRTRNDVINKLKKITFHMGYPEWMADDKAVDEIYNDWENIDKDQDAIELLAKGGEFQRKNWLYNLHFSETRLEFDPHQPKAMYNIERNLVAVSAAFLYPPTYWQWHPRYVNMGGFGFVVGHELGHGFDYKNRKIGIWWSDDLAKIFEEKAKCFDNQYPKHSSGVNKLGENVADNVGLRVAYKAYMKVNRKFPEAVPKQLNFTEEQLFFISVGMGWCSTWRRMPFPHEVHSLNRERINVPLKNLPEFSEAFKCRPNSPMNPDKKCVLW